MTEDLGMEAAVSLEAMMERHIAALSATSEAVRGWDERRAAGGVSNVVYGNALLEVTKEEEAARLFVGSPIAMPCSTTTTKWRSISPSSTSTSTA